MTGRDLLTTSWLDVGKFLGALDLRHLEARFADEDIDGSVFGMLGPADLKELGLTLGQRKKIGAALEALRQEAAPKAVDSGDSDAGDTLELRRVTVIFCDMVGSTELGARLTNEEMHDLLETYYGVARKVAHRFGGFIASLQGDGVIVLFGYPKSPESRATRAIGASLALQQELGAVPHVARDGKEIVILTRIGIATGQAIVGRPDYLAVSNGLHMVGPVINRAARLQTAAEAGTVIVDDRTRNQSSHDFTFDRLPDADLKGFDQRVPVSRVQGHRGGKAARLAPADDAHLIGREEYSTQLRELWRSAQSERSGFAIVSGEAGVGKSTLLAQLEATAVSEGAAVVRLACSALESTSVLRPVVDFLQGAAGWADEAPDATRWNALRHALGAPGADDLGMLGRLIGLQATSGDASAGGAAERKRLLAFLTRWLIGEPGIPRLVILEDAHWADATTLELMQECAGQASRPGALFIASSRGSRDTVWPGFEGIVELPIRRLDETAAAAALDLKLGDHHLPETIRQFILTRSDGNPLMLDALARSLDTWTDADLTREVSVPNLIYESIAGRLDELDVGKRTAAAMSVFDVPTDEPTLAAALGYRVERVQAALRELREMGIVDAPDMSGDGRVRFRHHLYREVIYERIFGAQRRGLHAAVSRALIQKDPDLPDQQPGIVAWHAAAAGDYENAAPLSLRAGEQFLARSALIEAGSNLEQALDALKHLPAERKTDGLRLRALSGLASIKRARLGIASDEAGALGRQVLDLARDLGEQKTELLALNGLYAHAVVGADYRAAGGWAAALAEAAEQAQDRTFMMIAQRALGAVALHAGSVDDAVAQLRLALDQYDIEKHLPLAHAYGYDHAEICAVFLSIGLWLRGDLAAAREMSGFSISHSRKIEHAHSLGQALAFRAMLGALSRDRDDLAEAGTEAMALADRFDLRVIKGAGAFFRDSARLLSADHAPSARQIEALKQAFDAFLVVNPYNYGPMAGLMMAEALLRSGDAAAAAAALEKAGQVQQRTGETWTDPELGRVRALVLAARGDQQGADRQRQQAFDLALAKNAIILALRIACDMTQSDPSEASRDRLLSAARRMISFDDGYDTRRCQRLCGAAFPG